MKALWMLHRLCSLNRPMLQLQSTFQLQPPDMVDTRDITNKGLILGGRLEGAVCTCPNIQDPPCLRFMSRFPKPGLPGWGLGEQPPKNLEQDRSNPNRKARNPPTPPPRPPANLSTTAPLSANFRCRTAKDDEPKVRPAAPGTLAEVELSSH